MQEGAVSWDPISLRPALSGQQKVFILYCLFVLGFAFVRSINLARQLWLSGALAKRETSHSRFQFTWEVCHSKVVGMRRLSVFTIVTTFLVVVDSVVNFLAHVGMEKQIGLAAAAGIGVQISTFVVLGLIVCGLLYGSAVVYEGVLARRMAHRNLSRASQLTSSDVG